MTTSLVNKTIRLLDIYYESWPGWIPFLLQSTTNCPKQSGDGAVIHTAKGNGMHKKCTIHNGASLLKRSYLQGSNHTAATSRPSKKSKINILSSVTILPPNTNTSTKQTFYVSNGKLKPITLSSNIKSGVFRTIDSTNRIPVRSAVSPSDNIVLFCQGQGRIVPIDVYNRNASQHLNNRCSPVSKILYRIVNPSDLKIEKRTLADKECAITSPDTPICDTTKRHRRNPNISAPAIKLKPNIVSPPVARTVTRCGRLSKPPSYMEPFHISSELIQSKTSIAVSMKGDAPLGDGDVDHRKSPLPKVRRQIPDHFKCNTCQKVIFCLFWNRIFSIWWKCVARNGPNHWISINFKI